MDIGPTVSVYTVEPVVSPVPRERERDAVEPQPDAATESTRPLPTPVESL